ncbi:MAG: energy transducer TonB [Terriglobales bacterium]
MWFTSEEMKKRATYRVDIRSLLKQVDIKGSAIVDILVNSSGGVACVKSLVGHPMIRTEVEKALKKWTFKPAGHNGHAVAYLGEMAFLLCNISCGDRGPSMTLLK